MAGRWKATQEPWQGNWEKKSLQKGDGGWDTVNIKTILLLVLGSHFLLDLSPHCSLLRSAINVLQPICLLDLKLLPPVPLCFSLSEVCLFFHLLQYHCVLCTVDSFDVYENLSYTCAWFYCCMVCEKQYASSMFKYIVKSERIKVEE